MTFLWAFLAFCIGLVVGHSMAISTTLETIAELQEIIRRHRQAMNRASVAEIKFEALSAEMEEKLDKLGKEDLDA